MRKRQQFDAATSEVDDDPADDGNDRDAHTGPDSEIDSEPDGGSGGSDDASKRPKDRSATPIDSGEATKAAHAHPFDSPGSLAGAPVDDHTPAWGATQVAAAMEAELAAARARNRAKSSGALSGSAAVLARLEALEEFGAEALTASTESLDTAPDAPTTRDSADPTPDSGVELAAPSVPMPEAEAAVIADAGTDAATAPGITPAGTAEDSSVVSAAATVIEQSDDIEDEASADADAAQAANTFAKWDVDQAPNGQQAPAEQDAGDESSGDTDTHTDAARDNDTGSDDDTGSDNGDGDAGDQSTNSWLANSRELEIIVPVRPAEPTRSSPFAPENDSGSLNPWRTTGAADDALIADLAAAPSTTPTVDERSGQRSFDLPGIAGDRGDPGRDDKGRDDQDRDDQDRDDQHRDDQHWVTQDRDERDSDGRTRHGGDIGSGNEFDEFDYGEFGDYEDDYDYDEADHRQPLVKGGHRWFRRQIRNYGPLLGLLPMALFGLLAWAGQQFSTNGSIAGLSIGLGAAAAPFLMIAGLPFGSSESYRIAVVGSIVIWLGIGWWASRRALAEPMPTWRSFFRQLFWLSLALGGGVLAAYAIALQALG